MHTIYRKEKKNRIVKLFFCLKYKSLSIYHFMEMAILSILYSNKKKKIKTENTHS